MNLVIDFDIIGEVLIPLDSNHKSHKDSSVNIENILTKNYKDFRSILFQGELLRLFVILKLDVELPYFNDLIDNLHIKFDFLSTNEFNNNEDETKLEETLLNEEEAEHSVLMTDTKLINQAEPFSLHRASLFNKNENLNHLRQTNSYNYENLDFDKITLKKVIKEKRIILFEVMKYIVVPNNYLNKNIIMRLNILKRNFNEHVDHYNLLEKFSEGVYKENKKFEQLKTIFKEVKIIRPVFITKMKQIDLLPDISLVEFRVENNTSSINFIDKGLKVSKFLNTEGEDEVLNNGIVLTLKEIQILKEETTIDPKTLKSLKKFDKTFNKNLINFNEIDFTLLNRDFPIEIKPGEEFVVIIKINKNRIVYHQIFNNDEDAHNNNYLENIMNLMSPPKSLHLDNNLTTYSNLNHRGTQLSRMNTLTSSAMNNNNSNSPFGTYLTTTHSQRNVDPVGLNISLGTQSDIQTIKGSAINSNLKDGKDQLNDLQLDDGNSAFDIEDLSKITLSTQIIIELTSYNFYDNLFMSIPLKWTNEIHKHLLMSIEIQENIKLHEYFTIKLKIKNISNKEMNVKLEISDSSTDFINTNSLTLTNGNEVLNTEVFDYKGKKYIESF